MSSGFSFFLYVWMHLVRDLFSYFARSCARPFFPALFRALFRRSFFMYLCGSSCMYVVPSLVIYVVPAALFIFLYSSLLMFLPLPH